MAYQYSQRFVALGAGTGSASTNTSNPFFVGDFRLLTCSFESSTTLSASRFTVWGSNADGLQTGDLGGPSLTTNWSLVTGVNMVGVTPGMITFDPPGYRWVRVAVTPFAAIGNVSASSTSNTTIIFNGTSW